MFSLNNMIEKKLINQAYKEGVEQLVVGAVVMHEKKVLIIQRNENDFLPKMNELPSGKVELNETLFQSLKRELKEEANLNIKQITNYLGYFDYHSSNLKKCRQFNFLVETEVPFKIILNENEHSKYTWINLFQIKLNSLSSCVQSVIKIAFEVFSTDENFEKSHNIK